MNSYEALRRVSEGLYRNLNDKTVTQSRLERAIKEMHIQVSEDFQEIFGYELHLEDCFIYLDDESYRQSATGLVLNESISNHPEFKIRIECLVDFGRIWIQIKGGKEISDFADIVRRIEYAQNSEGLSELQEIK